MLRACRRILRPGGRTAFFTIVVAPGLSKRDHRIAVRLGPAAIKMNAPIDDLMRRAGFTEIEVTDVTEDFLVAARGWLREYLAHEDELRATLGAVLEERIYDTRDKIRGIEEGLLQRLLVTGVAR